MRQSLTTYTYTTGAQSAERREGAPRLGVNIVSTNKVNTYLHISLSITETHDLLHTLQEAIRDWVLETEVIQDHVWNQRTSKPELAPHRS